MTKTKTYFSRTVWGLFLLFAVAHSSYGQHRIPYTGEYKLGDYEGTALYTYQVMGIDTILDGPFQFERSNLEALLSKKDRSFLFKGQFDQGYPQGDWLFQLGEFKADSTTQFSDFQYRLNVNGTVQEAKGTLNRGKPNGTWRLSHKRIENSQIRDTLFYSEIDFLDGVPQRSFRIEGSQGTLVGRFLRNGLVHDIWSLYSHEVENKENWHFEEGRLIQIELEIGNTMQSIDVFKNPLAIAENIPLDKGFGTLVLIYAQLSDEQLGYFSNGINGLLEQNYGGYEKIDAVLSQLGPSRFLPDFKVTVPLFSMDSLAMQQLDSTVRLVQKSNALSTSILKDTRLGLMRRSDREAELLFRSVATIDSVYLEPLRRLAALKALGIANNLSREMLKDYLFPEGLPSAQLTINDENGNSKTISSPHADSFDSAAGTITIFYNMAAHVSETLGQMHTDLKQKLVDGEQEQEIVRLEEQMMTVANRFNGFPDAIPQKLDKTASKALLDIKVTAERLVADYAKMSAGSEKLSRAQALVECLQQLDLLSQEITKLPEKSKQLEEKYTDAVWNPFTATIMDEKVKKRNHGCL